MQTDVAAFPPKPRAYRAPAASGDLPFPWKQPSMMVDLPTLCRGSWSTYYDPLYQRSCVEGRRFVCEFETSPDPTQDARRFVRNMARLIREVVRLTPRVGDR